MVSPRALLASVATTTSDSSPYRVLSIPRTMPRSTAQITGWSVATYPNGQCSLMIRSPLACGSGRHVGGEPVRGEGIRHRLHRRAQRPLPGAHTSPVRPSPSPGHRSRRPPRPSPRPPHGAAGRAPDRAAPGRGRRCAPARRASCSLDAHIALRRSARPAARIARDLRTADDLDISAGGELVEVVAGDVGVDADLRRNLGHRQPCPPAWSRVTGRCGAEWGRQRRR